MSMDRAALRAVFETASNPKPVKTKVAGLGTVYIAVQTAFSADEAAKQLEQHAKPDGLDIGRRLAAVICDEEGAPLFDIANDEDVRVLAKLKSSAIVKLFNAANKANSVELVEGEEPGNE